MTRSERIRMNELRRERPDPLDDPAHADLRSPTLAWIRFLIESEPVAAPVAAGILAAAIADTPLGFLVGALLAIAARRYLVRSQNHAPW